MSTVTHPSDLQKSSSGGYSVGRLFLASCIALIATAMTFAIRGDIMNALGTQFNLNKEQVGAVAGAAFYGFTISIVLGGMLCDLFGMGRLLALACVGHIAGIALTIFANGYWSLFSGTLIIGMANGLIEATANPLVATIYSGDKTHKLNRLHAWFPGGIVIGGLTAFALTKIGAGQHMADHLNWQLKMATIIVPTVIYGLLFLGQKFPATERVQSDISTRDMYMTAFKPLFLVILFCMLLTAATELGNEQWIPSILGKVDKNGILFLVLINGIMYFGRTVSGPVIHKLSPTGVLTLSAVFSLIGLLALSYAATPPAAIGATVLFAIGVCYFWPTMLGFTSERFPKGGPVLLGLMGAAGMLSAGVFLPAIGHVLDMSSDPRVAFRYMAVLPAVLIVVFGAIFAGDKAKGGYQPETLASTE